MELPSLICVWQWNIEWVPVLVNGAANRWQQVVFLLDISVAGACGVANAICKQFFAHLPMTPVLILLLIIILFFISYYFNNYFVPIIYTLSGRTGCALVWHTRGRVFEPRLLQQVLRFVSPVYTVKYVELRGYWTWRWGCDQSIGSSVSYGIVRSWLWSTATRSSQLCYFSILL